MKTFGLAVCLIYLILYAPLPVVLLALVLYSPFLLIFLLALYAFVREAIVNLVPGLRTRRPTPAPLGEFRQDAPGSPVYWLELPQSADTKD
jgi:hypothetical protein